ncbi:P-loop containing nucleoside triphosphate hydrolase protein [Crepidotus variabilis]|uniref:P-loop containing nucleoside triphosphate hydrolase protein n=1 Tax=Crepidotus variabilis TaxID=179855 RepID=A0A9P6EBL7_9AGAR|nr:P-loop containing nucleoside triphosphate hydrolase protein [Crepidotus variabilis]
MKRREGVFTPSMPENTDLIILVIGTTGAGKSTFVNAVAGYEASQASDDLGSCTREVKAVPCHLFEGRRVVIVDTPGFNDTNISDVDVFRLVATWLAKTYAEGIKLSGVLLFHRITDNRVNGAARKLLDIFQDTCGPDALRNALLVTTMWDEIDQAQGSCREQELAENFWSDMITRGARYKRFLNTPQSAQEIVHLLGEDASQYALQLQVELVDEGKDLARTTAGKPVFSWLHDLLGGIQKKIQIISKKLRTTKKGNVAQQHHLQRQLNMVKEEEAYVGQELKWYHPEPIKILDELWVSPELTESPTSISPSVLTLPFVSSYSTPGPSKSKEVQIDVKTTVIPPSPDPTPLPSLILPPDGWSFLEADDVSYPPNDPSAVLGALTPTDTASTLIGSSSLSTTPSTSSPVSPFSFRNPRWSLSNTTLSNRSSQTLVESKEIHSVEGVAGQNESLQPKLPFSQKVIPLMRRITIKSKRRSDLLEPSNLSTGGEAISRQMPKL